MYEVDVLVQGYPGKAVCHGGLGWSTIAMLRGEGRTILVDVGAFGVRRELLAQLRKRGVDPASVTDVVLTHAHYDHLVNFTLSRHRPSGSARKNSRGRNSSRPASIRCRNSTFASYRCRAVCGALLQTANSSKAFVH